MEVLSVTTGQDEIFRYTKEQCMLAMREEVRAVAKEEFKHHLAAYE